MDRFQTRKKYVNTGKYDVKACPWRLTGHNSVHDARCLKEDCLAWDASIGCKLIESKND